MKPNVSSPTEVSFKKNKTFSLTFKHQLVADLLTVFQKMDNAYEDIGKTVQ